MIVSFWEAHTQSSESSVHVTVTSHGATQAGTVFKFPTTEY